MEGGKKFSLLPNKCHHPSEGGVARLRSHSSDAVQASPDGGGLARGGGGGMKGLRACVRKTTGFQIG